MKARSVPGLPLALLLLASAFAGCISAGEDVEPSSLLSGVPLVSFAPAVAVGEAPGRWLGSVLHAEEGGPEWTPLCLVTNCDFTVDCGKANCERIPFTYDVPADYWETHEGGLEVSILWEHQAREWRWNRLLLYDASGEIVAEGSGGIGQTVLLERAPPGDYVALVIAYQGEGAYEGIVETEARPKATPVHEILPDLVVLPPNDLYIERPSEDGFDAVLSPTRAKGCNPYEVAEGGARRCLRFANRVGNVGEGPLEVYLMREEGAKAVAAQGKHVQRIWSSDGSFRDVDAGPATFHPTHSHFHYEGLNHFAVYEYDLATKSRGEFVNEGHKGGVCLVDSGLIALGLPYTAPANYPGTCFYPAFAVLGLVWGQDPAEFGDLFMHLDSNWYDLYPSGLDDMYVDLSGVPDGVYELVSSTNLDASIVEVDAANNEASVVFRLTGDEVEVVSGDEK
ncbi:MAG: hypothetical protein ACT4PT_04450 [Methanobacteriota archaeon]